MKIGLTSPFGKSIMRPFRNPLKVHGPMIAEQAQAVPMTGREAPLDRLSELGACARSLRHPDFSDGRDRAGGGVRPALCRTDRARHRLVRRLRRILAAGRLARRPLEPAQHDGRVLYRLRRVACWRGARAGSGHPGGCVVRARGIRRDLPPGRHGDADRRLAGARPHARVQRRLRQVGAALAAGITAALASWLGWRARVRGSGAGRASRPASPTWR